MYLTYYLLKKFIRYNAYFKFKEKFYILTMGRSVVNILLCILFLKYSFQFSVNNRTLNIGALFTMSDKKGLYSEKGIQRAEIFKLAVSEINIKYDINMTYNIFNDLGDISSVMRGTFNFLNNKTDLIIGPASSSLTEYVSYLTNDFETPIVSYASSSPLLSDNKKFRNLVRTVSSDTEQVYAFIKMFEKFEWELIGLIGTEDIYGRTGVEFIKNNSPKNIIINCYSIIRSLVLNQDIDEFVECVNTSKTKVVVIFMNEVNAPVVISKLREKNKDILILASDSWAFSLFPSIDNSYIKNTIGVVQSYGDLNWSSNYLNSLNIKNTKYTEFFNLWENTFKCKIEGDKECGVERDRNCKCPENDKFDIIPNPKLSFVYDSVELVGNAMNILIKGCDFDICKKSEFTPSDILFIIRNTRVISKSGEINIKNNDRNNKSFDYVLFDGDKWKRIGNIKEEKEMNIDTSELYIPKSVIDILELKYSDNVSIIFMCLLILSCVSSLCILSYFFTRPEAVKSKLYSNLFSGLTILGLNLIWLSVGMWIGAASSFKCGVLSWSLWSGVSLIVAVLIAKNYRIFKIYSNKSINTSRLSDKTLAFFVLIICGIELIILSSGAFYGYNPVITRSSVYLLVKYETCGGSQPLEWVSIGYITLLVVTGSFIAFLTRNVPIKFNESKHLAFCMYSIFLNILMLIPIKIIPFVNIQDGFYIRNILNMSIIFFGSIVIFLILFVPKVIIIYKKQLLLSTGKTPTDTETDDKKDLQTSLEMSVL